MRKTCRCGATFASFHDLRTLCPRCRRVRQPLTWRVGGDLTSAQIERRYQAALRVIRRREKSARIAGETSHSAGALAQLIRKLRRWDANRAATPADAVLPAPGAAIEMTSTPVPRYAQEAITDALARGVKAAESLT